VVLSVLQASLKRIKTFFSLIYCPISTQVAVVKNAVFWHCNIAGAVSNQFSHLFFLKMMPFLLLFSWSISRTQIGTILLTANCQQIASFIFQ